jgi:hypothetical protein
MSGRERELVLINLLGRKTPVEIAAGLIVPSLYVEGAYMWPSAGMCRSHRQFGSASEGFTTRGLSAAIVHGCFLA